jgi:Tol biopolymer transport system component
MTRHERLERDLTIWFSATSAPQTPDYVDLLLAQTADTRQRPAWTLRERWLPMRDTTLARATTPHLPWRSIAIFAALAVLLVASVAIVAGPMSRHAPAPYGIARSGTIAVVEEGAIVSVDPVTGARTTVVDAPARHPRYSRDGTLLAFVRPIGGDDSLWVANADGSDQRELSTAGLAIIEPIEWAPDGGSLAVNGFIDGTSVIALVPTDGGAPRVLDVGMPAEGAAFRPPDGREILFRGTSPTGFGLFAVRPDGTGLRPVTASTGLSEWDAYRFAWSPDGEAVAYQWREVAGGLQRLYIIPAEGGTPRAVTAIESVSVAWSPDGRYLAFVSFEDGAAPGDEAVMSATITAVDGSRPTVQIEDPTDSGFSLAWSPDGTRLLVQPESGDAGTLVDPVSGGMESAFTSVAIEDWQRLAP